MTFTSAFKDCGIIELTEEYIENVFKELDVEKKGYLSVTALKKLFVPDPQIPSFKLNSEPIPDQNQGFNQYPQHY